MGRDRGRVMAQAENMVKKWSCPVWSTIRQEPSTWDRVQCLQSPTIERFLVLILRETRRMVAFLPCNPLSATS
jgi:hypothetical protein